METKSLRPYLKGYWLGIREELLEASYRPEPALRAEIPKPDGGIRQLGIPTVVDPRIQQALLRVLTPIFDPGFSEHSFGFRPGKGRYPRGKGSHRVYPRGVQV